MQLHYSQHLSVLFKGESVIFAIFSCNFTNSKCSQVILKYGDRNMGWIISSDSEDLIFILSYQDILFYFPRSLIMNNHKPGMLILISVGYYSLHSRPEAFFQWEHQLVCAFIISSNPDRSVHKTDGISHCPETAGRRQCREIKDDVCIFYCWNTVNKLGVHKIWHFRRHFLLVY